jgi:hypothetical protein
MRLIPLQILSVALSLTSGNASLYAQHAIQQTKVDTAPEKASDSANPQTPPEATNNDPAKREPKQHARELLDKAYETASSARPEVQVAALVRIGQNYAKFDNKKAIQYLNEAFAATAASGKEKHQIGEMQAEVVGAMASVNLNAAIDLLAQIQPHLTARSARVGPTTNIVNRLISENKIDRAVEVLDMAGSEGEYPFRAAAAILRKLPVDDPRRATIFSSATSAYQGRPYGPFFQFVAETWKSVPDSMLEMAVRSLVNAALDRKEEPDSYAKTLSTAKGVARFGSRTDAELFELFHLLKKFDPKRAAEILEKRPSLQAMVEQFPMGSESMYTSDTERSMDTSERNGGKPGPEETARMQLYAMSSQRNAEAMAQVDADPRKALSIAGQIPMPDIRAETLGVIASKVSEKDAALAKSVLDQCVRMLDDIKEPQQRAFTWRHVADAAHRIHDHDRAWKAVEKGLDDAAALYKADTNAESPNTAWRDHWPSTQAYRSNIYRAGSLFGGEAEALLPKITDPDLQLLATVELAQALLKVPQGGFSISVSRSPKK